MKITLKPTLWRTCRALMNPTRLRLFRIALEHDGELCVRDYARHMGLTDSVASIYLRQLNARGLLGVRRDRIKVFYNAENDRTLPDAREIQSTLRRYFATNPTKGWEREVMTQLRAFSHFNRLAILVRLASGPATLDQLFDAMGVCVKSVYHHLGFLFAAGLIREERIYHQPSRFSLVRPAHPLSRKLLDLTLADVKGGVSYYNEGSGRGRDAATKAVLKKIRKSGDSRRDTWRECGPMKPRKGRLRKAEIQALRDAEDRALLEREMKGAFDFAKAHPGKILWNGEFGTIRHADPASRVAYMRDVVTLCREHGIPWCVWNYLSTPNDGNRFSLVDDDTREFLADDLLNACLGL